MKTDSIAPGSVATVSAVAAPASESAAVLTGKEPRRPRRYALPRHIAFAGLALVFVALLAAAAAPSPFFVLYQAAWGFPSWLLSFAFAIYAVTLLGTLLTVGSLSDYIGRRPVLIGALIVEAIAMALFVFAPNIETVVVARAIQGIATGAATGAVSAALTDMAPARNRALGAVIGGLAPFGGLAVGAILAGVVIQAAADPVVLTFLTLATVFVLGAIFIALAPESVSARKGALRSLVPHVAVPLRARGEFWSAVPVYLAGWMTGGLFLGLVPEILRDSFHIDSGIVSGGVIAVLSAIATLSVFLSRRVAARTVIIVGSMALVVGIAAVAGSILLGVFALFWIGTMIAGVGFGMGFAGEIRVTAPLAQPHERGELFAAIYVVAYLSFGVPAIIAGAVVGVFHLVPTVITYALIVVASAAVGAVVQSRRARRQSVSD